MELLQFYYSRFTKRIRTEWPPRPQTAVAVAGGAPISDGCLQARWKVLDLLHGERKTSLREQSFQDG
jgi:hypothetical protein